MDHALPCSSRPYCAHGGDLVIAGLNPDELYFVVCGDCGEVFFVETMHDGEAILAMHYAGEHGRTGKIPRPAIVAEILEYEIAQGLA